MYDYYSPQAIWGRELRHYRMRAGLTQQQLSELTDFSESTISSVETGQAPASIPFAEACEAVLETGGALIRNLDCKKAERFPSWFGEWPVIEGKANMLRTFQLSVVYGLLQKKAYAHDVLDGDEAAVAARLERQHVLTREDPPPPKLRCIFDYSVLIRPTEDPAIMSEQLAHVIEAIELRRISVRVIPFGIHPGLPGSFVIASLGGSVGEVAYVETALRGQITRRPDDLETLADVWESIQTYALPKRESLQLIKKTVEERWT